MWFLYVFVKIPLLAFCPWILLGDPTAHQVVLPALDVVALTLRCDVMGAVGVWVAILLVDDLFRSWWVKTLDLDDLFRSLDLGMVTIPPFKKNNTFSRKPSPSQSSILMLVWLHVWLPFPVMAGLNDCLSHSTPARDPKQCVWWSSTSLHSYRKNPEPCGHIVWGKNAF